MKPGETTSDSRILVDALDLKEIRQAPPPSGGSFILVWDIWCKAKNHLGGSIETPHITVTFSEKA